MSKNTGTSELINYFTLGASGAVDIGGNLTLSTITNATTDTDKFLVSDTGIIKYRTGAELLTDIGAAPAVAGGYVPYTGAAASVNLGVYTLTANAINSTGSGSTSGQINLRSDAFFSLVNGYGTLGSGTSNTFVFYQTTALGAFRGAILSLNSITASATRTFTLPDADGTLALTSQIPANAVGGTGTLNTIPKFTAATTIGNSNIFDSGSIIYNTNPAAGQFAWQFNGSTIAGQSYGAQVIAGTNASDIGFKVMNAAASINYLVVRGDGLVTLTGALNGTTATFTNSGGIFSIDTNGHYISKQNLDVATAGGRFTGQSARGTMGIIQIDQVTTGADGGRINFSVSPSGSTTPLLALTLASTGAATFSGDLTANVGTITFTNAANIYMSNIIRNGTTGNAFFQYDAIDTRFINLNGSGGIAFRNNANTTNLLNITDVGKVGIGTPTPSVYSKLTVTGSVSFNNNTDGAISSNEYGQAYSRRTSAVVGGGSATSIKSGLGPEASIIVVCGRGPTGSRFADLVLVIGQGTTAPLVIGSRAYLSPASRTYTNGGENLLLQLTGDSDSYSVFITGIGGNELT